VGTGAFHNLILVLDGIANEIARLVLIPWKEMEVVQTTNKQRHGSNAGVACLVIRLGALGAARTHVLSERLEPGPNALGQPYFNLRLGVARGPPGRLLNQIPSVAQMILSVSSSKS
jgi:hypothetical protein